MSRKTYYIFVLQIMPVITVKKFVILIFAKTKPTHNGVFYIYQEYILRCRICIVVYFIL